MKDKWMCTKCMWQGVYSETKPVMYRGIDWQHCPSCNSVAIPLLGSFCLTPAALGTKGRCNCGVGQADYFCGYCGGTLKDNNGN